MNLKSVKNLSKPKYPDKTEIELNSALLHYQPKSWLKKPIIGLTLSALITAGVSGCNDTGVTEGDLVAEIVYLSEHDALAIIADELSKIDCKFELNNENDEFDASVEYESYKVQIEYVSKEDCEVQKHPNVNYSSTCRPFDIATQLIEENIGAFYDPYTVNDNHAELIRAQVADFLESLATQIGE